MHELTTAEAAAVSGGGFFSGVVDALVHAGFGVETRDATVPPFDKAVDYVVRNTETNADVGNGFLGFFSHKGANSVSRGFVFTFHSA